MNDSSDTTPPSVEDIDLYCLQCGYNLRGQCGDPRRCPECFYLNPVGDLEIPAAVITAQIRRMESAPAGCVGMVLVGVPLLIPAMLASPGFIVGGAIALALWIRLVVRFRFYCMVKSGWRLALVKYHVYGLAFSVAILVVPLLGIVLTESEQPWLDHPAAFPVMVCVVIGLGLLVILGAGPTHAKLKAILEPLQREVAVTLARDGLRQALRTGRRTRHFRLRVTES